MRGPLRATFVAVRGGLRDTFAPELSFRAFERFHVLQVL